MAPFSRYRMEEKSACDWVLSCFHGNSYGGESIVCVETDWHIECIFIGFLSHECSLDFSTFFCCFS